MATDGHSMSSMYTVRQLAAKQLDENVVVVEMCELKSTGVDVKRLDIFLCDLTGDFCVFS